MVSYIRKVFGRYQQRNSLPADEDVAHKDEGTVAGESGASEAQSYDEIVEEITRVAYQRLSSGESLRYFETHEKALGFEMYQAAIETLPQVIKRGDGSTALAVIEFLEAGPYPGLEYHAQGLHLKGCALLCLRRHEEALSCFDQCFSVHDTEVPEVLLNRASALWALGRHQEALASLDHAGTIGQTATTAEHMKQSLLAELIANTPKGEEWEVAWYECGHWVKCHLTDDPLGRRPDMEAAFGLDGSQLIEECPVCGKPISSVHMIPLMFPQPTKPAFDKLRSAAFFAPFGVLCGGADDIAFVPGSSTS